MPTTIVETPIEGTPLVVPVGTDKRKASSLMAAWQAIGNRLLFLENFIGTITGEFAELVLVGANTFWKVADGKTWFISGDTGGAQSGIFDLSEVWVNFTGRTTGTLVTPNRTGRVPKKVNIGSPPTIQVDATFDPRLFDTLLCTPASGAINLDLSTAGPFALGEHFRVSNFATSAGFTIAVRDSGHTVLYTVDPASSANHPCFVDMVYNGTSWYVTGQNKVV